ncbi:MAG: pseudouridine synthase [Methylococcaceae bacterium]|nr:MAG: pseudouridine synthase [Methylococcaceae bacterium]
MPQPSAPRLPTAELAEDGERIQKVLARAGLGSRREIEQWIALGAIRVNGQPVKLGDKLHEGDQLSINGRPVDYARRLEQTPRVLLYHKPSGELVTRNDPEGRPVIFTQLPRIKEGRWIAVGRLDVNTQGLLLVTNHGELANRLMHPSFEMEREYAVRVLGSVSDEMLERLTRGITLEDGPARFESLMPAGGEGANHWYHVTLKEGRNRIVRRMFEALGVTVSRLIRIRYGDIVLPPRLKACTFSEMSEQEVADLMVRVGLIAAPPAAAPPPAMPHQRADGPAQPSRRRPKPRRKDKP